MKRFTYVEVQNEINVEAEEEISAEMKEVIKLDLEEKIEVHVEREMKDEFKVTMRGCDSTRLTALP
jgi:hypothetical protein